MPINTNNQNNFKSEKPWDRRVVLGIKEQASKEYVWHSRGYLPHFDATEQIQHITFHLADSLPRDAIMRMQYQLELKEPEERDIEQRKKIQGLLDKGLGSCILGSPECAKIVEDSLLLSDGKRYSLLSWCIMPNHVHVLIEQKSDWSLSKIIQSWKRHTSRYIHLLELPYIKSIPNPLWQREYWDRYIRDYNHFNKALDYIENNPVKAGLISKQEDWVWGSIRHRGN